MTGLVEEGKRQISWAEEHMPVLASIREDLAKTKPLRGYRVGFCLHVTKETAVLVKTLASGGAEVSISSCNPLSTSDAVAAALAGEGFKVYAKRGETKEQYYAAIDKVLDMKPHVTVDDGCDLVSTVHTKRKELIKGIIGGCEETTTGIHRLKAMEKDQALKYPIIAVNDSQTKFMFDNRYGTGQSSLDGILRATSLLIAGKNFVVAGYGWCGRGLAMRAKGMGARVIITEVDPVKALEAAMEGYQVMPMADAAKVGDIFVTTTGNKSVIRMEHIFNMKKGAVLANSGHFNVEIVTDELEKFAVSKKEVRKDTVKYTFSNGKYVYLLGEGRLVNLAAAEGHPPDVMDMSFANQALAIRYIIEHPKLPVKVHLLPKEIDQEIARLKLQTMGFAIDSLLDEQRKYMSSWQEGT